MHRNYRDAKGMTGGLTALGGSKGRQTSSKALNKSARKSGENMTVRSKSAISRDSDAN